MLEPPRVQAVPWEQARERLLRIRHRVFVEEQGVPPEMEEDSLDAQALHVIASTPELGDLATGRLLNSGQIGRMAVLAEHRGRGIGAAILVYLLNQAQANGHSEVFLNAQCTAKDFYTRHGFTSTGEVFMEAGIPHQKMTRSLLTQR